MKYSPLPDKKRSNPRRIIRDDSMFVCHHVVDGGRASTTNMGDFSA